MSLAYGPRTLQGNGQRFVQLFAKCACGPPMATNSPVFRGHGAGVGAAAEGGAREEAEGSEAESSAESVTTVNRLEHFFLFLLSLL